MSYDVTFTNGVIKSKECTLLGGKIERMIEGTYDEAVKTLRDSGFGGGVISADIDALIRGEEEAINTFIRQYSPDAKTTEFLLADYDFHNAEGLVKVKYAGADEQRILTVDGFYTVDKIRDYIDGGSGDGLCEELKEAIKESVALFEGGIKDGFEVDCIFKRALMKRLSAVAKGKQLKSILSSRADNANVSSALRSRDEELMKKMFVEGGKLPLSRIIELCKLSVHEILDGKWDDSVRSACRDLMEGKPFERLEKDADDYPLVMLSATAYEMKGKEPFIGYIYKRRADVRNARIVAVSLRAGISPQAIKKKIRVN